MAYIGSKPGTTFQGIARIQSFTGDGSTTAFDLTFAAPEGGDNDLQVFVNNVRQKPGSSASYTLGADGSGDIKRITFNVAPAAADEIYVINPGSETSLIAVSDNSVTSSKINADAITGQTELATEAAADDVLLIYDTDAAEIKKIQKSNLASTGDLIQDDDNDTKIQAEESADEDILRFDTAGTERLTMDADGKFAFTSAGGGVINSTTISNTYTITNQNLLLAGPVTLTGTITVGTGATMVVV